MQEFKLASLAEHVGGTVIGDGDIAITSAAPMGAAARGDITFLSNVKYRTFLNSTSASAVIVQKEEETTADAQLVVDDPYYAFCCIVELIFGHREHRDAGISPNATIHETASIGSGCCIYDNVVIENDVVIGDNAVIYPGVFVGRGTKIGSDCILYPNSVVFEQCSIGDRVIIQANATVGQDGFGFATYAGEHHKIPHIKSVILEDDVEIGANAAIERGSLQDTIIGSGAKIGDCVVIGHGARIGRGCLLVPQVGIAGTAELGQYCVLGGQSAVVGHIKVGNMVMAAGQSAIINDIEDGKVVAGAPAIDAGQAKRAYSMLGTLPEMKRTLKRLSKRVEELETALAEK
ncbi:MAG: UDP-3-O-(3-hydroxymyristoyl)glucosamine N-acyltransferase [Sedimentisphaeraceae bacterium JB056]